MEKKMKVLIMLIVLSIFIILFILISLSYLKSIEKNSNNNTINNNIISNNIITNTNVNYIEDGKNEIYYDSKWEKNLDYTINNLEQVNNRTVFFSIKNIIERYINLLGTNNIEPILDIIPDLYIKDNNINEESFNIETTIPRLIGNRDSYTILIDEMLSTQIDKNKEVFLIKGRGRKGEEKFNFNYLIEVDNEKELYMIFPTQYTEKLGYSNLQSGDVINYKSYEIKENINNKLNYLTKDDFQICRYYFNSYKELLINYIDEAYNKLDESYRNKRFSNLEKFKAYIDEYKHLFSNITIEQYKVISNKDYIYYICSDQYGRIYIFRQQGGIMNYTVFLDNYTVILEDLDIYNSLSKLGKTKECLNKFINMVNTKDYNAIYKCLDVNFKNNNFSSEKELEKVLVEKLYEINSYTINESDTSNNEYVIFNCKISNKLNMSEETNMYIIIKIGEGTDFTMSFSFE